MISLAGGEVQAVRVLPHLGSVPMKTVLLQAGPQRAGAAPYPFRPRALPPAEIRRGNYALRFARTRAELDAALRLRFEVFNLELKEGLASSYLSGLDEDEFDQTCHHLLVREETTGARA